MDFGSLTAARAVLLHPQVVEWYLVTHVRNMPCIITETVSDLVSTHNLSMCDHCHNATVGLIARGSVLPLCAACTAKHWKRNYYFEHLDRFVTVDAEQRIEDIALGIDAILVEGAHDAAQKLQRVEKLLWYPFTLVFLNYDSATNAEMIRLEFSSHRIPICSLIVTKASANDELHSMLSWCTCVTVHNRSWDSNLTEVALHRADATNETVMLLSSVPALQKLYLTSCPRVTDVRCLTSCQHLVHLDLEYTSVGDDGIVGIETIPKLRNLNLLGCRGVTDVRPLALCASLTELDISWTGISNDTLVGLENIATLRKLSLLGCRSVTDVRCLAVSPSLTYLDLYATGVSNDTLPGLELIVTLRELHLQETRVSDVRCLCSCPSLTVLTLSSTGVTNEGLEGLQRIPTLQKLNLRKCYLITDVRCLASSPSLNYLDLRFTRVTRAGLAGVYHIRTLLVPHRWLEKDVVTEELESDLIPRRPENTRAGDVQVASEAALGVADSARCVTNFRTEKVKTLDSVCYEYNEEETESFIENLFT